MKNKNKISIIVPCFNEEEALSIFYEEIMKTLHTMKVNYEILFVNDGSKDNTISIIKELCKKNLKIKYISFSRNFGKEAAIYAGLCNATGDFVTIMDADLQDPPYLLPEMYDIVTKQDYDSVATRRISRKGESKVRSWFARRFYKIINLISDADIVDGARDYRLMNRKMVNSIISMAEYNRFSKGIFGWVGFKTYWLPFENVERVAGTTSWSFWKLFKYAIDGIINFSNVPLKISSFFGILMTFVSFIILIFIVIRKIIYGDPVQGWASIMCTIIFIGGVQLLCLGVIGQYIGEMYSEEKKRPHYIIDESNIKE